MARDGQAGACLYAFDLLHLGARGSATRLNSANRRGTAKKKLLRKGAPVLDLLREHMDGADGEAMFRHACATGLDGIISETQRQPLQKQPVPQLGEGEVPG